MANFSRISELNSHRTDWIVRVKVLKKWSEMKDGSGNILRFLLVDENGDKIPAEVSPEIGLYEDFNLSFFEGQWKVISRFHVTAAPADFRFSENQWQLIFTEDTNVEEGWGRYQEHYMKFKDFNLVKNGYVSNSHPIDLIGYLDNVAEIDIVRDRSFTLGDDKNTTRVRFWIKDLAGITLECRAYDVLAIELYNKWKRHGSTETFITLSDWKVFRVGEGAIKVKDAGGISRFEFNAEINDVYNFSSEYFGDDDGYVEELVVVSP